MRDFLKKSISLAFAITTGIFTFVPESFFAQCSFIKPSLFLEGTWLATNVSTLNIFLGRISTLLLAFALALLIFFIRNLFRRKILIKGDNYIIEVKYGDLLKQKKCKRVISFDECYTTKVGEAPEEIKPSSICGQYLLSHPDLNMSELISKVSPMPSKSKSRFEGKECYDSGLIVPNGDDLLLSFAKLDEDGRGQFFSREEYLRCLERLWKVSMPYKHFLGYEKGPDGTPVINEEQAETVRLIFRLFLEGRTPNGIRKELEERSILSPGGSERWTSSTILSILSNEKYKGDALLQKRFTVDFLTKVMKKNEGEVPSYYVEDSHPAIIDPAEFDMVQAELARRKAVGRSYSGTGLFASKLYCADCGGVFGQKVWHSTDKYRRVVLQCNNKFKRGKSRCTTPILTEQGIQEMFLKAYAALLAGRQDIINDCEAAADMLTNVDSLNRSISAENERLEQNTELIRAVVREHASIAQSEEEYHRKYDPLMEEHDAISAKLDRLIADREAKIERGKRLRSFLSALKVAPEELLAWDEQLWLLLVDHATVNPDGSIEFSFKNGTDITVSK